MSIKLNEYATSIGTVSYYETSDHDEFDALEDAEIHQKFLDEVKQFTLDGVSALSGLRAVYIIQNQPQLDMFLVEMGRLESFSDVVHYEMVLDNTVELIYPMHLCLSYIYDDEDYNVYTVDTFENVRKEWFSRIQVEKNLYHASTEALWNLNI